MDAVELLRRGGREDERGGGVVGDGEGVVDGIADFAEGVAGFDYMKVGLEEVDGVVALDPKNVSRFKEDPRRPPLVKKWIDDRNQWVITELPARKAMLIFDRLYALRAQLERETEQVEFMLGDGIIDWYPLR